MSRQSLSKINKLIRDKALLDTHVLIAGSDYEPDRISVSLPSGSDIIRISEFDPLDSSYKDITDNPDGLDIIIGDTEVVIESKNSAPLATGGSSATTEVRPTLFLQAIIKGGLTELAGNRFGGGVLADTSYTIEEADRITYPSLLCGYNIVMGAITPSALTGLTGTEAFGGLSSWTFTTDVFFANFTFVSTVGYVLINTRYFYIRFISVASVKKLQVLRSSDDAIIFDLPLTILTENDWNNITLIQYSPINLVLSVNEAYQDTNINPALVDSATPMYVGAKSSGVQLVQVPWKINSVLIYPEVVESYAGSRPLA